MEMRRQLHGPGKIAQGVVAPVQAVLQDAAPQVSPIVPGIRLHKAIEAFERLVHAHGLDVALRQRLQDQGPVGALFQQGAQQRFVLLQVTLLGAEQGPLQGPFRRRVLELLIRAKLALGGPEVAALAGNARCQQTDLGVVGANPQKKAQVLLRLRQVMALERHERGPILVFGPAVAPQHDDHARNQ